MTADVMNAKKEMRAQFRMAFKSLSEDYKSVVQTLFSQNLLQLFSSLSQSNGLRVASFQPDIHEPVFDESLFSELNIEWVYPKVVGEDKLDFYSHVKNWIRNEWGILEPDPNSAKYVDLSSCHFCIVPAVAYDRMGSRLGRGKGYYDKALSQYPGIKVGLAYTIQISEEEIPVDEYDVFVDYLVTEKYILKPLHQLRL